jgi:hypothetical protein
MVTLRRTWDMHFRHHAEELLAGVQVGMAAGRRCRTHSHINHHPAQHIHAVEELGDFLYTLKAPEPPGGGRAASVTSPHWMGGPFPGASARLRAVSGPVTTAHVYQTATKRTSPWRYVFGRAPGQGASKSSTSEGHWSPRYSMELGTNFPS